MTTVIDCRPHAGAAPTPDLKAIKAKQLPSYRVGACVRVRIADVDALAKRDVTTDEAAAEDCRRAVLAAAARGGRR